MGTRQPSARACSQNEKPVGEGHVEKIQVIGAAFPERFGFPDRACDIQCKAVFRQRIGEPVNQAFIVFEQQQMGHIVSHFPSFPLL